VAKRRITAATAHQIGLFPASTSGNTGSGLTFSDWTQSEVWVFDSTATYDTSVTLGASTVVNTLLSSTITSALASSVTFTNSLGATDTFTLVQHATIRRVYSGGSLSGASSNGVWGTGGSTGAGSVTAVNWATGLSGYSNYNADAQEFTLPASWAGTTLTDVAISVSGTFIDILGLQVISDPAVAAPEPMSLALLATGFLGLLGMRRRLS
jgi:hypothetical protein